MESPARLDRNSFSLTRKMNRNCELFMFPLFNRSHTSKCKDFCKYIPSDPVIHLNFQHSLHSRLFHSISLPSFYTTLSSSTPLLHHSSSNTPSSLHQHSTNTPPTLHQHSIATPPTLHCHSTITLVTIPTLHRHPTNTPLSLHRHPTNTPPI